ncbi:D-2-hydroxyacid dehydrogenase [Brevibacterium permense]|uniref:D-2-hydroxyacid dehydrogenase n=1 Tax=Brevibacterium permense TaxID=234834 RepID=UPI0021CE36A7|nr:D-2-hydroxyacid dehydrogenase [Brevibacterium permense]MCU4298251.1 D-2-hydroxyacid dehydrogenase [Brevibacterium permense]
MLGTAKLRVAILDRPGGADSPLFVNLPSYVELQRLLPEAISTLDPRTEVMLIRGGFWTDMESLLDLAPALKWIHVNMAGLDQIDLQFLEHRGVMLTDSRGVLDIAIAEFVLGAVLQWSKGLHVSVLDTQQHRWVPREPLANRSVTTLVLGAGGIGTRCARALKRAGFGAVAGFRRQPLHLDPIFDEYVSAEKLPERIGDFDVVVACLPAAPSTEGFINRHLLERLRRAAVFVNVGRGSTVDQVALADVLAARPASLAVLDVTAPEPLPGDHPLLSTRNVVISPHMAGETVERHDSFTALFIDNLQRYCDGTPLKNCSVPS